MRQLAIFLLGIFCCNLSYGVTPPDEGMYPISMINKLPLKKAGLKLSVNEIYNPNGQALMQAVVQIGGCTGSFVSEKGLIVTNHHCAFGSLQAYSTPENNLLEKGYLAKELAKELPVKGLTAKILESYDDVSEKVLANTKSVADAVEKKKIIEKNIESLYQNEKLKHPNMTILISEMLPGKSYIAFRYQLLKDIRVVYIPARNIGEFGGETDNWEWPRHTGDFSFLRAYTGKDGNPADFDSSNIPYRPKQHLSVSAKGVNDSDFVFILGYPGRTYRHQPAEFINYQMQYQLPYISELFEWQINTIRDLGKSNDVWMISNESRVKRLANVEKNYKGKIKSLSGLNLYEKKKNEEQKLIAKLSGNPQMQSEYRDILKSFDSIYSLSNATALKYLYYNQLLKENSLLKIAYLIGEYKNVYPVYKDSGAVLDELTQVTLTSLRQYYKSMYIPYDSTYLIKMLTDAKSFEGQNMLPYLSRFANKQELTAWVRMNYNKSKLLDSSYIFELIREKPKKLSKMNEPIMDMAQAFYKDYVTVDNAQERYKAEMEALLPRYVDIKMEAMGQTFIPDANSTLRFTYGYVKGYAPRDAVFYLPVTTVAGMIAKDGMQSDYNLNETLERIYQNYVSSTKKDVPLCLLYNTDTTGGNSGSPLLNEYGQLVGINFDRAYEATVNDFAWDDAYSRSIGVDMRFVVWMLSEVADADHLVKEMSIE